MLAFLLYLMMSRKREQRLVTLKAIVPESKLPDFWEFLQQLDCQRKELAIENAEK